MEIDMFIKTKNAPSPDEIDVCELIKATGLRHVAFIMDGNGRWATQKGLPREAGHGVGAKAFKSIVKTCRKWGLEVATVYAFSTENWKRPQREVSAIMRLLDTYIKEAEDENEENNTRFIFIGDITRLGEELCEKCRYLEKITADNEFTVNIALNYGGRNEIVHAVNTLIAEGKTEITEDDISANLYTFRTPDPDLIIRTGNEIRLSNFLLWQSQYSELYFTECLWPDFDDGELEMAIREFSRRKRRFGGV